MHDRIPSYFQLSKYRISPNDVARTVLGCDPEAVRPDVIVTPLWSAGLFSDHTEGIVALPEGVALEEAGQEGCVYELRCSGQSVTFVRSGIGAPQTGDVVLALGCTPCERLVFIGSVGGLNPAMNMGDLLIPERSLTGDGFSRYLDADVHSRDRFLDSVEPDSDMRSLVERAASAVCESESVALHAGPVFSTDSIVA